MKKFLAAAAFFIMSLCFGGSLSAGNVGVLGGATFYNPTNTQWHAGLSYKMDLPLGFHLQPAVMYNAISKDVGRVNVMGSVQWGIDLILFRPFVDVSPFAGYGLNDKKWGWGAGVGGGLDIWRFQVAARYNWDFAQTRDFNAVTLTLSFFF